MNYFIASLCLLFGMLCPLVAQSSSKEAVIKTLEEFKNTTDPKLLASKEKWETVLENLKTIERNKSSAASFLEQFKALNKTNSSEKKDYKLDEFSKLPKKYTYDLLYDNVEQIKGILITAEAEKRRNSTQLTTDEARLPAIPKELGSLKAELTQFNNKNAQALEPIDLEVLSSKKSVLESSISKLENEKQLLEVRVPSLKAELSSNKAAITDIHGILDLWLKALEKENRKRAVNIKADAERLMVQLKDHPQLKSIADLNLRLVNQILAEDNLSLKIKEAQAKLEFFKATYKSLEEQKKYAKKRLLLLKNAKMPIDRETGQLLRNQRANLPSDKELKLELKHLFQRATRNEVAILELNSEQELLPNNVDAFLKTLSLKKGDSLPTKANAKELILSCNSLCSTLIKQRENLSSVQSSTIDELEKTITNAKSYTSFLDARLLWIVSHPPIDSETIKKEIGGIKQLFSAQSLQQWFAHLKQDWFNGYGLWLVVFLICGTLVSLRGYFKKHLPLEHEKASKRFCTSIKPTIIALALEIALQLTVPLLIGFIGWRSLPASPFGAACLSSAIFLFVALLLRAMTKEKGFAVSHFDLREKKRKLVRQVLSFIIPVILPLLFLTQGLLSQDGSEGRILTMISLLLMGFTMQFLLWPKKNLLAKKSAGVISYASYLLFAVFPFILAIAAAVGYFVSVLTLRTQLIYSIRLVLVVMLISAFMTRWLLVSRRRIASETAQRVKEEVTEETPEAKLLHKQELRSQLEQITQVTDQSAKLIKVVVIAVLFFGLTSIWAHTLPALNILNDQELWTTTSTTVKEASGSSVLPASGAENQAVTSSTGLTVVSVTLQDLLISLIVTILTYIAATNIPGLLRMTILDRLNLKTGAAFGVTTVVRYIITIVGIVWVFNNIGITWDKVQWIAAAVTLGIGFGLQEIFANFVAGIILLFERPVRIGDLVTIGGVNGKVSKIAMRATTILQFNNRELIVPNKEFITGQLVNWTLSDNIMRAEVIVGVAYGSDTELVKTLLLKCASDNPRVLSEPKADVVFSSFGASSLDFKVRVFVKSVDDLVPVQSELHFAIDKVFREADIEIAFPQQDIHIRSIDAALPIQQLSEEQISPSKTAE